MSELLDKINKDLVQALKEKKQASVDALRYLKAAIEHKSIEKKKEKLTDEDVVGVIKKQVKQIKDSIIQFKEGKRDDLVEKEEMALEVIKKYMPDMASPEEIKQAVSDAAGKLEEAGQLNMGALMKEVMGRFKGRADGKTVSDIVKEKLAEK